MTNNSMEVISTGFQEYSIYFLSIFLSLIIPLVIVYITKVVHLFARKAKTVDYNLVTTLAQSNEESEKLFSEAMKEKQTSIFQNSSLPLANQEIVSDRIESRFFRTATVIFPVFGLAILLIPLVTILKERGSAIGSFLATLSVLSICVFVVVAVIYAEKKGDLKWDKQ